MSDEHEDTKEKSAKQEPTDEVDIFIPRPSNEKSLNSSEDYNNKQFNNKEKNNE